VHPHARRRTPKGHQRGARSAYWPSPIRLRRHPVRVRTLLSMTMTLRQATYGPPRIEQYLLTTTQCLGRPPYFAATELQKLMELLTLMSQKPIEHEEEPLRSTAENR